MNTRKKRLLKVTAGLCGIIGFVVLGWTFFPIIAYQIQAPDSRTFLSPIAGETDYTKASSWFPEAKAETIQKNTGPNFYKLSIPRLGIKNATVSIGGEDLSQSLIQYPGTAVPGQVGDAVIFGHSVLPAFYNPTNYLTIFSTLPTLAIGETITVNYDSITYKYQVEQKFEVGPTDIGILEQNQSDSFLTLVTCVPPGLQTRRLIVKARIVPISGNYE